MTFSIPYSILILLPLLGGMLGFVGKPFAKASAALMALGLLLSSQIFFGATWSFDWQWIPGISLAFQVDRLSGLLIFLVYLISFLVHLFSLYYMGEDQGVVRYFFQLGFFTSSMLGLLAADSLILLFVFWELVGFASYLLIGFWFTDPEKASSAKAAFMVNRVADGFLLIGVILLIGVFNVPCLSDIAVVNTLPVFVSLLLAIGAFGKSAQFPFSAWLNKAMAGPTPVSALIHAATMVTAGVYLLVRFSPIMAPEVLVLIAAIGGITACMAAFAATTQTDIKAVLAYSTISQLGFMTIGVGVGAADAAVFHLWTHAFFKAGLFLSAGSVIHYLRHHQVTDSQDMRTMGGLRKYLPVTFISFLICGAALAGLPFFSGFLSKEGILIVLIDKSLQDGGVILVVGFLGFTATLLTPYYIARQIYLVFFGTKKAEVHTLPEPLLTVKVPLLILALASFWILFALNPFNAQGWWLQGFLGFEQLKYGSGLLVAVLSLSLTGVGLGLAYIRFVKGKEWTFIGSSFRKVSFEGWFLERIYSGVSVGFLGVSKFAAKVDMKVVDTTVNAFGISVVVLSKILGWFDRYIVDGCVNVLAALARMIGRMFTRIQAPLVQFQVAFAILVLVAVLYWVQNL